MDDKEAKSENIISKNETTHNGHPKTFRLRNSLLTDLMKINHFQSVHNGIIIFLVFLFLYTVAYYITAPDVYRRDMDMVMWLTGKKILLLKLLLALNVWMCIAFYVFIFWIELKNHINSKVIDGVFVMSYLAYILLHFIVPAYVLYENSAPPFPKFIVGLEQLRLQMKIHSFIRENVSAVTRDCRKNNRESSSYVLPTLQQFVYFLFAPTFIYRSHYPRTNAIRWKEVFAYLIKFLCTVFVIYTLGMRFYVPVSRRAGLVPYTMSEAVLISFGCMACGVCLRLCIFLVLLHFWLNLFAELLRFGDREFYQDWWNSISAASYMKRWNLVVYEWLRTYIYIDLQKAGCSRWLSWVMVYFLSAAAHEYFYAMMTGFVLPHMFILQFLSGVVMISGVNDFSNNFGLIAMSLIGDTIVMVPFFIEAYARVNCPGTVDDPLNFFIPRILSPSCQIMASS